MITSEQVRDIIGAEVRSSDDQKIGDAGQVYLDDATGRPEWVTVKTGLFGTKETFVPLAEGDYADGAVRVPYSKDMVKGAPSVDPDQGHLDQQEEAELYRYYGLEYGDVSTETGMPDGGVGRTEPAAAAGTAIDGEGYATERRTEDARGTVGHDTSGPTTDDAMTRSEERLRVGKQEVETGRARLRKYVTTENVTETVPVSREEVRVEREPITDANAGNAYDGPAISEEEHEVVLHEERPVVQKEAVPVERVRLTKEEVRGEETISDEVRKEQIDEKDVDLRAGTETETRRQ